MKTIRDSIPPKALLDDDLVGTFGMREIELAVKIIIKRCVEEKSWKVKFRRTDFEGTPANYALDGFDEMTKRLPDGASNWLVITEEDFKNFAENVYSVHPAMIHRLKQNRPAAFQ